MWHGVPRQKMHSSRHKLKALRTHACSCFLSAHDSKARKIQRRTLVALLVFVTWRCVLGNKKVQPRH